MARKTLGDKASRALTLLMGLRNPRIAQKMERYGFDDAELARGWQLLQATGTVTRRAAGRPGRAAGAFEALEAWQKEWFAVAEASLTVRFPKAGEELFKNLAPAAGPAVVVTVQKLLERVQRMGAGLEPFGPEGIDARALLTQRGLSAEVIENARALLDAASQIADEPVEAPMSKDPAAVARAEAALWAYYLEWSRIARVAITARSELRQLGFLRSARSAASAEEETAAPVSA